MVSHRRVRKIVACLDQNWKARRPAATGTTSQSEGIFPPLSSCAARRHGAEVGPEVDRVRDEQREDRRPDGVRRELPP